jgi:hypothetical protein
MKELPMSDGSRAPEANPYAPPQADFWEAWTEGRYSFLAYRRECLGHETLQRCIGLADQICAWAGALILAGCAAALVRILRGDIVVPQFSMIQWVVGSFVLLPALVCLLLEVGTHLSRRRRWAWRVQVGLSGCVVSFLAVSWTIARSQHATRWGAILAILTVGAHAAMLGILLSRRGVRIVSPRYETIVAETPALTRSLGLGWVVVAVALALAMGIGLLALQQWLGWQAAYVISPLWDSISRRWDS